MYQDLYVLVALVVVQLVPTLSRAAHAPRVSFLYNSPRSGVLRPPRHEEAKRLPAH